MVSCGKLNSPNTSALTDVGLKLMVTSTWVMVTWHFTGPAVLYSGQSAGISAIMSASPGP